MPRLYLSPPDVGAVERAYLLDAFDSNWIAPVGPHVDALEKEMADAVGVSHAVALSSGTAALHLALLVLGVAAGDEVLVPTMTFAAPAFAVTYVGAEPTFVDSDRASWNVDPGLVAATLAERAAAGRLPAAVIAVDLYGQCADYGRLVEICGEYGVPLIEDAAEALGATCRGRPAGAFGELGVLSFNGNKIVTTGGGGMIVTDRPDIAERARHLATQAREPVLHYEHADIGFNYRMSNLGAAIGRAQLATLEGKVDRRREICRGYRRGFAGADGLAVMPEAPFGRSSRWLTVVTVDAERFGAGRDDIVVALEAADIEARPAWKPMHRQPVFAGRRSVGGHVADALFETGVCLPSGTGMTDTDVDRVVEAVLAVPGPGR